MTGGLSERRIVATAKAQDLIFAVLGVIVLFFAMAMLATLIADLLMDGLGRIDAQFLTAHLARFGAMEIPKAEYKRFLEAAIGVPAQWLTAPDPALLDAEIRAMRASATDEASHGA
jgi:hypothetical protein